MKAILARLLPLTLLAGCLPPSMPPRQDPFAGLGVESAVGSGFSEMTAALVSSANTRETVSWGSRVASGATKRWLKDEIAIFKRNFGRVVTADSLQAGFAAGADVVIVYDVYDETKTACKYDETLAFFTPDGKEIERVKGDTDIPFGGPFTVNTVLRQCMAEVQGEVERGIRASKALRELADRKAGRAAPAAAQAPAAPAPRLPAILRPAFTRETDESSFALVVGVEKYSRIPQADFAERDAQAVREHLLALGVPQRNIIHLSGPEASYSAIKKYLESWLPKNVSPSSRVYFYFSGHGAPDTASGAAYLLPWDGDPAFLKDTAYPTKRLYEQLASLPAGEVIVAMDACFSGAGGRSVLAKGARPLVSRIDAGLVSAPNLTVFSASAAEQITGALEDKGHGVFTYYYLKGLGGEAKDARGVVTAKGLYEYLRPKVQDEARRQNRDQDPALQGEGGRELNRF